MRKQEQERLAQLDKTLACWAVGNEEHRKYREAHPDKPLTPKEVKELEDYQNLTYNPKWW